MVHGHRNRGGARHDPHDEATVVADIRYFVMRLDELGAPDSARDRATAQVYRLLLRQRRQLLAAIRDGVPERWPEYLPERNARDD